MNPYLLTLTALAVALAPFVLGVATASWRQRRRLAQRSRTLTIDLGPKVLLGFALSTTAAAPTMAATGGATATGQPATAADSTPLPTLDRIALPPHVVAPRSQEPRPAVIAAPSRDPAATPTRDQAQAWRGDPNASSHVVRSGESLWSITRERLGPDAADAQIARTWPTLWAANRAVIGADPAVLFPGQRLHIPAHFGSQS